MVENVHSDHDGDVQVGYFALDGVVRSLTGVNPVLDPPVNGFSHASNYLHMLPAFSQPVDTRVTYKHLSASINPQPSLEGSNEGRRVAL
jgi:hypothetical protein